MAPNSVDPGKKVDRGFELTGKEEDLKIEERFLVRLEMTLA